MPKLKTRKSVVKKVKITARRKVLRRYTKQNHYNSRQTGKFKRKKRGDKLTQAQAHKVMNIGTQANRKLFKQHRQKR